MAQEIEFQLSAAQYQLMGYPGLKQGQPLSLVLDGGVLLPDPSAETWFAVQPEQIRPKLALVGAATYAYAGQIQQADIVKENGEQTAMLVVDCAGVPLRVTCAPKDDGMLPFGTWETRYLTGMSRIQGLVEDDYSVPVGKVVSVTLRSFRRMVLTPGDPFFGEWYESFELPASPYQYDYILVTARLHRLRI